MEQPEEFLYGYRGPWPCHNPVAPVKVPPVAVLLPDEEMRNYRRKVLRRYLRQRWTGRPAAWLHAYRRGEVEPIGDEQFTTVLVDTAFSRLLNPVLDPNHEQTFAAELRELGDEQPFILDYSVMDVIRHLPGLYSSPSVTLLKKDRNGQFHVAAIALPEIVLRPTDGNAWELAKYFVLQGASHLLITLVHPLIHFPLNPANALAKTLLPRNHVLLQLLLPHLELQLGLESGVLFTSRSILHNRQGELYAPFCGERESNFYTVSRGYFGVPGNSSYTGYRYQNGVGSIHSGYGVFLDRYYQTILKHSRKVLSRVSPEDPFVRRWARHCAEFIPGFPDEQAIANPESLAAVAATIICTNSVSHTSDHHFYGGASMNQIPLRLRVPAPTSREIPPLDRAKLVHREDFARQHLANQMFFKPTVVTRLIDAEYQFQEPELESITGEFREALRATDRDLPGKRYVPLEAMASSIQF